MSENESVADKVRKIIDNRVPGCVPVAQMTDNATFDNLGLDSLDFVEVVMEVEETFGIEISDEELEPVRTLGDFVKIVEAKSSVKL